MKVLPVTVTNQLSKIVRKSKVQQKSLPIVATPIVAYYIGESQDRNAAEIIEFLKRKHIKIPDYLKPHPDTKTGFNIETQTKIKNTITDAYNSGKISEADYIKYKNKVNFTGHGDDISSAGGHSFSESGIDSSVDTDIDDDSIVDTILDFLDDLF